MYDIKYLVNAIDSLIESSQDRLNKQELQLLQDIRIHISDGKNEKEVENAYLDLIKWLLLVFEYLKNTS